MSEVTSLPLVQRQELGKGPSARLRENGFVPGIFYNSQGENIPVTVSALALGKAFEKVRYSKMLELQIEVDGKVEKRNAFFKKLESHPVKRRYDHVDFVGVDLDKEVEVLIPVVATGKSRGVVLGGKLDIFQERIMVRCLPANIPDSVVVNITDLGIGDKVFMDQLNVPSDVKVVYGRNVAVLAIQTARGAKADEEDEGK